MNLEEFFQARALVTFKEIPHLFEKIEIISFLLKIKSEKLC